jgi:hypothetical protein
MTATAEKKKMALPKGLAHRILAEGYGPGAWHGADMRAALSDVTADIAFWRPQPERHNIAEIALHHAYCQHSVRGRLVSNAIEPFVIAGEDWFEHTGGGELDWPAIQHLVQDQQNRLASVVSDIETGRATSPLSDDERFGLVLGITCHAVYHAGQVQLIKRLRN